MNIENFGLSLDKDNRYDPYYPNVMEAIELRKKDAAMSGNMTVS